jgi:DNA-binding NarL/FixJ family response regulator
MRALKAGAAGYLTKQSAADELINAIRQVAHGRKYVTASLAEALAENLGKDVEQPRHETLSDREYQTLCLIAQGKSLTQIAEDMCLSVKTVSVYRSRLLQKMELKNNPELIHYAIKNGLVEPL